MTIIAMSALLLGAPLSALRWGVQWELFRWIIPVFLFLVVCKIATADDRMSEIPFVQPLLTLLFCWISYSMQNNHAEEEPAEYHRRKRNKRIKVSSSNSVTPPPKRKTRKDRKKKARMEKEKSKEDKDDGESEMTRSPHHPRFMQPLAEFDALRLSRPRLYGGLSAFLLTPAQLLENDFPLDDPADPGRVRTRSSLPRSETTRRCARCRARFHIVDNAYVADTRCAHHPVPRPSPATGRHPCCGGDPFSPGCTVAACHVTAEHCLEDVDFRRVRNKRHVKAGESRGVYGLDCEMSYTTAGLEVTKVCLLGADGIALYDTHVRPDNPILDYNTRYSGVTADDLARVTTTLADVQAFLLKTLNGDSILVGHALSNDLKALRIVHERVVDTSVLYPHPGGNPRLKCSLRALAKQHLGRDIQGGEHDCVEDARTCLALALRRVATLGLVEVEEEEEEGASRDENRNAFLLNNDAAATAVATQMHRGEMYFVPYRCGMDKGVMPSVAYQPHTYWNIFYPR